MFVRIYVLITLILCVINTRGQILPLDAPFTHITVKDGLPNLTVNSIVQDADGYIWMGTSDGLCRYDGYNFKVYRNERDDKTSLPDNMVYSLCPASGGGVWIGTNIGGLARYIPETDNFIYYQHNPADKTTLSGNRIQTIYEDHSGILWIGTYGAGLNTMDIKSKEISIYRHSTDENSIASDIVLCIVEDDKGNMCIRTDQGVELFNRKSESFIRLQTEPIVVDDITSYYDGSLFADKNGTLWVTENNHLLRINTELQTTDVLTLNEYSRDDLQLIDVIAMNDQYLWVSHLDGVFLMDKAGSEIIPYYAIQGNPTSILPGAGMCMLQDRTGSFWVSHPTQGISKLNVNRKAFQHFNPEVIGGQNVKALLVDSKNSIWISVDRFLKKLNYNAISDQYELSDPGQYRQYFSTMPNCFMEHSNGDIWIGTWGNGVKIFPQGDTNGIRILAPDSTLNSLPEGRVQVLYEDSDNNVWIGTEAGLTLYNPKKDRYRHFFNNPDNPNSITPMGVQGNCIVEDAYGSLWVGTWGGLTKMSPLNKEKNTFDTSYDFIQYRSDPDNANSLSDSRVISIFYDERLGKEILYAGTYGGGINRLSFNNKTDEVEVKNYTTHNGLSNNVVYCMLADNSKKLWISTNDGLSCLNTSTDEFVVYDANDGLQANQFFWGARARGTNGELLFGGINGFSMFNPDEIVPDPTMPSIVFTDLKVLNKSVHIGKNKKSDFYIEKHINELDKLTLSHRENVFTIEFAGLHYAFPENNRYKYMLEGFDKEWIEVDSRTRFATYTNMGRGNYTFKVLASNYDGLWTKEPRKLEIRIKPPFWKRWWFRILILLLIIVTAYEVYRRRMETLKRDKELLEAKIREGEKLVNEKIKEVEHQEEEIRKRDIEGAEMRFINRGIALFSEILSLADDDLKEMCQRIVSEMVKYINGVLGVIYVVQDDGDEKVLEMYGAYAADAETMNKKFIEVGEGYVGTCFRDGKSMIIKDAPEGYVNLQSGLGAVAPKTVCIIPIKQRDNIQGVIEIGALAEIEDYKVGFIEKIGENITAAISIKKATAKMNFLLEQSQQQTEELQAAEEEMRQNLEEMQATQEELERQVKLSNDLQDGLKKEKFLFDQLLEFSPVRVNFKDNKLRFIKASKSLLTKFGKDKYEEIIGMTEFDFASKEYAEKASADDKELMRTRQNRINFVEHEKRPDGSEIWKNVSKISMYTQDDECMGVLSIVYDLTESKLAEIENECLTNALIKFKELLGNSASYLIINKEGTILAINDKLSGHFGLEADAVIGKPANKVFKLEAKENNITYNGLLNKVLSGESVSLDNFFTTRNQIRNMKQVFTAIEISRNTYEIVMIGTV